MRPGWGLVLSAEHATNHVPADLDLGLPAEELAGHRAWDPGTAELGRALAEGTGAPLFSGEVSRLVVDLNRREGFVGVVPEVSFGLPVPGNRDLPPAELERRLATWHRPFRAAVAAAVEATIQREGACLHLSLHSFTPVLDGVHRPVEVGVLLDPRRESELAWAVLARATLEAAGLDARLDEPYRGVDEGFTTFLRERLPGERYAGLELELSQGLADSARARVAAALVGLLTRG